MSTVLGSVVAEPGCPGPAIAGKPCPPLPVAGAQVQILLGNQTMAAALTDSTGHYALKVPVGGYTITAVTMSGYRSQVRESVTVTASTVTVDLVVDSGMR